MHSWLQFVVSLIFCSPPWSEYRDSNGKVTPEEVKSAAMLLKDNLDTDKMHELIGNLHKDSGKNSHTSTSVFVVLPRFAAGLRRENASMFTMFCFLVDGKILVEDILKLGDAAGAADKKLRRDNQDKPEPKSQPLEKVV